MCDYREAELDPPTRALMDYAVKLTRAPASMGQEDVDRLRAHGFDDAQVYAANLVASYFNFINRVADGLGVELEPDWEDRPEPPPFRWP